MSQSNKIVRGVFKGGWMLVFFPLTVSAALVLSRAEVRPAAGLEAVMDYLMIFVTLGVFLVLFIVCLALFDDPKEPLCG